MDQYSPTKKRLRATTLSLDNAKKMRGSSPQGQPHLRAGMTPSRFASGLQSAQARRAQLLAAQRVSFISDQRALESPNYNRATSYFESVFEELGTLGAGDFGQVFKCRCKDDGNLYAIKKVGQEFTNEKIRQNILQEVRLMETLNHENIVRFKFSWQETGTLFIQTELCTGDLLTHLKTLVGIDFVAPDEEPRYAQPEKVPESFCWAVLADVLQGAAFIHQRNVIHLDIKPENIFLGLRDGRFKIGDFGIARRVGEDKDDDVEGDGRYAAQETYQFNLPNHQRFTTKADTFSIGCTVAQVALGIVSPRHARYEDYWSDLKFRTQEWETIPAFVRDMADKSADFWKIIKWLLGKQPEERPTTAEALADAVVQQHVQERQRHLQRDRVMSRIRGVVSNVLQLLAQFLPVDVMSRVRSVLPVEPDQREESRLIPPPPATPKVSSRATNSAALRRSRAASTPSIRGQGVVSQAAQFDDERGPAPVNLSACFLEEA